MFRLMRNIHLGLGLVFVLMAMIFAVSSLVIIYRPLLGVSPEKSERTVQLSEQAAAGGPRAAARELMENEGFRGELRQIQEDGDKVSFRIFRPGEGVLVEYSPASRQAKVERTRHGALETMVQLHVNHGFWHDYGPSNIWALIGFLASVGLLLLGVTGIYLWWVGKTDRAVGSVLVSFSLVFGAVCLYLTRLQQ